MTVDEVADLFRLSISYLRKLRANGCGPKFARIGIGGEVRYKRVDVERWYKTMEVKTNGRFPQNVEE